MHQCKSEMVQSQLISHSVFKTAFEVKELEARASELVYGSLQMTLICL